MDKQRDSSSNVVLEGPAVLSVGQQVLESKYLQENAIRRIQQHNEESI